MKTYWLSCMCKRTFEVFATFSLEDTVTYTHCPECCGLIKLWGEDDFFFDEEEAYL